MARPASESRGQRWRRNPLITRCARLALVRVSRGSDLYVIVLLCLSLLGKLSARPVRCDLLPSSSGCRPVALPHLAAPPSSLLGPPHTMHHALARSARPASIQLAGYDPDHGPLRASRPLHVQARLPLRVVPVLPAQLVRHGDVAHAPPAASARRRVRGQGEQARCMQDEGRRAQEGRTLARRWRCCAGRWVHTLTRQDGVDTIAPRVISTRTRGPKRRPRVGASGRADFRGTQEDGGASGGRGLDSSRRTRRTGAHDDDGWGTLGTPVEAPFLRNAAVVASTSNPQAALLHQQLAFPAPAPGASISPLPLPGPKSGPPPPPLLSDLASFLLALHPSLTSLARLAGKRGCAVGRETGARAKRRRL